MAEENGALLGAGTLVGNHVTRVFVSPDAQGQGLGTVLLDALEAQAAQAGYEAAVLIYAVMEKRLGAAEGQAGRTPPTPGNQRLGPPTCRARRSS